jgi:hypothetical protein
MGGRKSMSYATENDDSGDKRSFQNLRFWRIGLLIILLATGVVFLIDASWNPISVMDGGLIIESDSDTRIYVRDKQVGTTSVVFSWGELIGDESHSAIAVELSDPDQFLTAEMLSVPNGTIVSDPSGMGFSGSAHVRPYLIRRADGVLDHVFALIVEWPLPNHARSTYLLPIRLRQGPAPSVSYFDSAAVATSEDWHPRIMRVFYKSLNERNTKYSFTASHPPSKFAEEIKTKGLWEPSRNN